MPFSSLFRSKPEFDRVTVQRAITSLKSKGWYNPSSAAIYDECKIIAGRNHVNNFDETLRAGNAGRRKR